MMAHGNNFEMMEGFLCPICKGDFGSAAKLLSHFQDEHSEEQDLLKAFKELFGKAKKILKNEDDVEYVDNQNQLSPSKFIELEEQEIGATKSHYDYFENIRSVRLQRFAIPVNQIIIRLDKLLVNMPQDPVKKKVHEQNVVPWVDGTAVTRCPTCTRSFHLTRRQHHCRLCGTILCHGCSSFISIATAWKILEKQNVPLEDGSERSTLRICQICLGLLETRQRQKDNSEPKNIISQLYEKLSNYQRQAGQDSKTYIKMYKSLCDGETFHNLDDAQALRVNIVHLAENIDRLSAAIAVLGTKDVQNPPQPQALSLQKAIRSGAITYLRTKLLTLPTLPTEEELKKIIENRRREAILARRKEEQFNELQYTQNRPSHQKKSTSPESIDFDKGFSVGQGWIASTNTQQHFSHDDPLLQQINIIQSYIREARNANRDEEVASLEKNLDELRQEYWRNLQEQERKNEKISSNDGITSDQVKLDQ